jgi:predicted dinucleotide-binding enzyme
MPTIPELRDLAKANKVYVPSRCNKSDIEELLAKAGVAFEASAPRSAKQPVRVAVPAAAIARLPGDLAELTAVQEDRTVITYYVPFSSIPDFAKLKAQIKLPLAAREVVDRNLNVDYLDALFEKALHTVEGDDGFEPQSNERIVFSANVLVY